MKKLIGTLIFIIPAVILTCFFIQQKEKKHTGNRPLTLKLEEDEQEAGRKRWEYEWKMLHDPHTGKIPADIQKKEAALLRSIIARQSAAGFRPAINNTYNQAGPSQNGGRTRALAYDMRGNNIVLAAGVSGGIFRSTNNGSSWAYVHPSNDIRNVNCFAQDPRPGFQDTWYAGTGELLGSSPSYPNAFMPGYGVFKSTDNGVTWSKLSSTISNSVKESFDNFFDVVFNIKVDGNGTVFAAILGYVLRSTNGGNNWAIAIHEASELSNSNQNPMKMMTDIEISKPGVTPVRYFASFTGTNRNRDTAGVWTSTTGLAGSWVRIAGGRFGNADSVAGWKAYNPNLTGGTGWGRTIMASAPNNSNILYIMYQNSLSAASSQPEADLFRADLTNFPTITWSPNRNANLKALRNNTTATYMETQEGYDMLLAVHPTNPNLVLAGGVNLFKSTDAFATQGTFIGGRSSSTYTDPDSYSHVDFHSFSFDPSNANKIAVGNDGGLQVTNDITAANVAWNNFASQYQTMQYYHIAIDPVAGSSTFAGGAQDNSTTYRDSKALFGPALSEPNDHYVGLIGGDGGKVGLSASTATQQYLYGSAQNGVVARYNITSSPSLTQIDPSAAGDGEFVTYFHLDPDNTETLYFVSLDSIWRTSTASTVTQSTGWTLMTGVSPQVKGSIFSLATSRGTYNGSNSYLFIGTDSGKIYRLQNPRDGVASASPVDISPLTGVGMTTGSLVRQIAVNPRNPDTVLAVVSNYGVASAFFTGNATAANPTWQAVEGNIALSSFRSCAIVATTFGVEYYVGTSIGLFSTSTINGNSTNWTLEGPAMMQGAIVNDLALRTADNTLLVGTHGNGMFYAVIGNSTPVSNVVQNDKIFISLIYPTVTNGTINFVIGNATGIKTMHIRLLNMKGQLLQESTQSYQSSTLQVNKLPAGTYIINILSDNGKYKHIQKFVKAQ